MTGTDNSHSFLSRRRHILTAVMIGMFIFILDLQLPLGVADGVLYVALVLIGLRVKTRRFIFWAAAFGTALTLAGFFLSPPGGEFWKVLANRALAVITIWITAYLCLWQIRAGKKLQSAYENLEEKVRERTARLDQTLGLLSREKESVQLQKDIAVASNQTHTLENALQYGLRRVCEHARWPVGHVYLPSKTSTVGLISSGIWFTKDPKRFATLKNITENTVLKVGEGLPGRVLESGQPTWIMDVTQDANFPRAKLVQNIGVKAGFAFPILIGKEVAGVMEFFSSGAAEPDEQMLEIMGQVGTQLGRVMERERAEEAHANLLKSLRERIKELTSMYSVANLVGTSRTMKEVLQKVGSYIVPRYAVSRTDPCQSQLSRRYVFPRALRGNPVETLT